MFGVTLLLQSGFHSNQTSDLFKSLAKNNLVKLSQDLKRTAANRANMFHRLPPYHTSCCQLVEPYLFYYGNRK